MFCLGLANYCGSVCALQRKPATPGFDRGLSVHRKSTIGIQWHQHVLVCLVDSASRSADGVGVALYVSAQYMYLLLIIQHCQDPYPLIMSSQ